MNGNNNTDDFREARLFDMARAQSWEQISKELEELGYLAYHELQETSYSKKTYLLHLVLQNNGPLELVQNLVNLFPLILSTLPLPLHIAVRQCAAGKLDLEIVKFLAEQQPEALFSRSDEGLPLHVALWKFQGSLDLIDFLLEKHEGAVLEKSAAGIYPIQTAGYFPIRTEGIYPIEAALLNALPIDRIMKMMISFSDHTHAAFLMNLVKLAFQGNCSAEVLVMLMGNANTVMAGDVTNDFEKKTLFIDCVTEAFSHCRDSASIMLLFHSPICDSVCRTADGARSLLEIIFKHGRDLVTNCVDGDERIEFFVKTLIKLFPELAASEVNKTTFGDMINSLHTAILRGAPPAAIRVMIGANPAVLTEPAQYSLSVSLGLHKRESRSGVALFFALHRECGADVIAALLQGNPQTILCQESRAGSTKGSNILLSVIQAALDYNAKPDVFEVLLKYAKDHLRAPEAWSECLDKALERFKTPRVANPFIPPAQVLVTDPAAEAATVATLSALILHILSVRPEDATRRDGGGQQPVHETIDFAPTAVILKLLDCNRNTSGAKKAAKVQLSSGTDPSQGKCPTGLMLLHMAVNRVDVLQTVIGDNPEALAVRGAGFTPIEHALRRSSPIECVKILMQKAPPREGLCAVAVKALARFPLCEYLFEKYPHEVNRDLLECALRPEKVAAFKSEKVAASEQLVDKIATLALKGSNAGVAGVANGVDGGRVLALALRNNYSADLFAKLLQLYPGAASDNIGTAESPKYLLHNALQLPASSEVVSLLLKEFPAATFLEFNKVQLWDQIVRDSEKSQLSSEVPSATVGKYMVNKEQVVEVCLTAVCHNNAIFTSMMNLRELHVRTATEIIHKLFHLHPGWTYLCKEAAEKAKDEVRVVLNGYLFFCGRYEQQIGAPLHCSATAIVVEFHDHGVRAEYAQSYDKYVAEGLVSAMASVHIDATPTQAESLIDYVNTSSSVKSTSTAITDNKVSATDYTAFCVGKFGRTRKVVIKFMRDATQFEREKSIRLNDNRNLDEKYVVPLLQDLQSPEFVDEISKERVKNVTADFRFGLVMPAADRSVEAIFRSERPGINHVRMMMYEIGQALQHCHKQGIVHGDLKMLNVLRVNGHMRLIDMDAAAEIGVDYLGAKFSSGVLPPEMFEELPDDEKVQSFRNYWEEEAVADGELWHKIQPRTVTSRGTFVVKTYRTASDGAPDRISDLPYKPILATAAADIWAFGCMLYTFLSGEPLLAVNRDDDLIGGEEYIQAASWNKQFIDGKIITKIRSEECYLAMDLLSSLLNPDAARRGETSIETHLKHPFFLDAIKAVDVTVVLEKMNAMEIQRNIQHNELMVQYTAQKQLLNMIIIQNARIEDKTQYIGQMADTMILQINRTEKIMLKAMFEAADVIVPSCFVILNRKMEPISEEVNSESAMEIANRWTTKLAFIARSVADTLSGGETSIVNAAVAKLMEGEVLWLYLVDEYTNEPVVGQPNYPIRITEPSKFVPKVLPLLQLGLKAVSAVNTAASIARCLGYPAPRVPDDMMDLAKGAVDGLSKKSNVEEYDCLQSILDTDSFTCTVAGNAEANSSQTKSLRGAALREFARFLAANDKDSTFSGLCRVATENGMCCWTLPENVDKVNGDIAQLEEKKEETATAPLSTIPAAPSHNPPPLPVAQPVTPHPPAPSTPAPEMVAPQQSKELELAEKALAAYAQQVQQLQSDLAVLRETNVSQTQTIALLAETIPKSLHAMRTDIVNSVTAATTKKK